MVRLGDICEILNGLAFKSEEYCPVGIRVIRITNVQKGYIVDDDPKFFPAERENEIIRFMLKKDDLLISLTGNVGRVGILRNSFLPAALNQRVGCLRNKPIILKEYLYWVLNTSKFEYDCINSANGLAQKNLSTEWLKDYKIPLPPLEEQKRIAAMLDKVQSLIDLRKKQIAEIDVLAQSVFLEMFGDPVVNKKDWLKKPLKALLEAGSSVTYGIVQTGDDVKDGVPVFRPIDIVKGNIPKRNELKRTTQEISDKYRRTLLKGYELLITVRGSVGDTFQVSNEFKGCNVARNIVPLRFNTKHVIYPFMEHLFKQTSIKDKLAELTKGIALQGLNMNEFREVSIMVPPLNVQSEFAIFIKRIDK